MKEKKSIKAKVVKIGSKNPKTKELILPSGLSEIELLKIRVEKLEKEANKFLESLNTLLEQSGLRPVEEDVPQDKSVVRYGES